MYVYVCVLETRQEREREGGGRIGMGDRLTDRERGKERRRERGGGERELFF